METTAAVASKTRLAQSDIHEQWESDYLNPDIDKFYDAAFALIGSNLSGSTILDIGCGYCVHAERLAGNTDMAITAVDFSQAALNEAAKTLAKAGISSRVTLQQADALKLPFANESFDNVLIWGVLMHIPDIEQALSEAARVLKPGGKLVLSENNAASIEVTMFDGMLNGTKKLLGRKTHKRTRAKLGIEEWQEAASGTLCVRKTDMPALVNHLRVLKLHLDKRIAGQFTELYARLPTRFAKRLVHQFNLAYFNREGSPNRALGNILIFKKG